MSSIIRNDLANGSDVMARDTFFTKFYNLAYFYEVANAHTLDDAKANLTSFLRKNIDSSDLLDLINYNIANAAYPRTRVLVESITPVLTEICDARKMLAQLTA